jgi:hypothetical protein
MISTEVGAKRPNMHKGNWGLTRVNAWQLMMYAKNNPVILGELGSDHGERLAINDVC